MKGTLKNFLVCSFLAMAAFATSCDNGQQGYGGQVGGSVFWTQNNQTFNGAFGWEPGGVSQTALVSGTSCDNMTTSVDIFSGFSQDPCFFESNDDGSPFTGTIAGTVCNGDSDTETAHTVTCTNGFIDDFNQVVGQTAVTHIAIGNWSSGGVRFFPIDADGDIAPTAIIDGPTSGPTARQLAVSGDELFVGGPNGYVRVFSLSGSFGDPAPLRSIEGGATGITGVTGILVANNELFVTQQGSNILVFPATADGNVAPSRTISGSGGELSSAHQMAVNGTELIVASFANNAVLGFNLADSGAVAPIRNLSGASTGISAPRGIAVYGDELYVAGFSDSVLVFAISADGNTAPLRTIAGASTGLNHPEGVFVTASEIFVANENSESVLIFDRTANGDVAPIREIGGAATGLGTPLGVLGVTLP